MSYDCLLPPVLAPNGNCPPALDSQRCLCRLRQDYCPLSFFLTQALKVIEEAAPSGGMVTTETGSPTRFLLAIVSISSSTRATRMDCSIESEVNCALWARASTSFGAILW